MGGVSPERNGAIVIIGVTVLLLGLGVRYIIRRRSKKIDIEPESEAYPVNEPLNIDGAELGKLFKKHRYTKKEEEENSAMLKCKNPNSDGWKRTHLNNLFLHVISYIKSQPELTLFTERHTNPWFLHMLVAMLGRGREGVEKG